MIPALSPGMSLATGFPLMGDLGLYLHVPFCIKRCHFCAFYLVLHHDQRVNQFIQALAQEIQLYAGLKEVGCRTISSLYIGGGTPTSLMPGQLSEIIGRIRKTFWLSNQCEVTVEATPESITAEYAGILRQAGVTRLSLGIQSFHPQERTCLGLTGTVKNATEAIDIARQSGFSNINLDLMYGFPGQTLASWGRSLRKALELDPSHLSCYALSIEEGTRFHREFRLGRFERMDPDREMRFLDQAEYEINGAGFHQYEISNWAKPGYACQHNLRYWQGLDYLGLGPSAQSYLSEKRFGNVANLARYAGQLENSQLPIDEQEQLSTSQQDRERVVFGLRLLEGVPVSWVEHLSHDQSWLKMFDDFVQEHYVVQACSRWRLTRKGRRFADTVGMQLLYG